MVNRPYFGTTGLLVVLCCCATVGHSRELTFEDRVKAQGAIERVYYSHQIGATKPFEEAVPRAVLEKKVRTYLKQSVALGKFWKTPITDEMLERELERMANGTRMPERLLELYGALGNDPFLIKECLARAALANRLSHNFFAFDGTIHAAARAKAEALQAQLSSRELSALAEHPDRTVVEFVRKESGPDPLTTRRSARNRAETVPPNQMEMSAKRFDGLRTRLARGAIGSPKLTEERDAVVVEVVVGETPRGLQVARYSARKVRWEQWWQDVSDMLGEAEVNPVASPEPIGGTLPMATGRTMTDPEPEGAWNSRFPLSCTPDDTWNNGILDDAPAARDGHAAVWTGSVMVIWGGAGDTGSINSGSRYDPATDTWTPISSTGAPSPRQWHSANWTGARMVVWGGYDGGAQLNSGGRYDPVADSWAPMSMSGAPSARSFHTAVWTGSVMIIWGGRDYVNGTAFNTGGRYNPTTDSWAPTSMAGVPSARSFHTAVWTGNRMIVWGGSDSQLSNTGGRYDPVSNSWTPTSVLNAPLARRAHTAVWTGSVMIVWGGDNEEVDSGDPRTGGRYDPVTDTWTPTSTADAPDGHCSSFTSVWTGDRMVVWGGSWDCITETMNTGARYNPATDTWSPTSMVGAPRERENHTAIWTGSLMIIWGGDFYDGDYHYRSSGGRYNPSTDTWTPTSGSQGGEGQSAVWTGSLMVVWGGGYPATGGRYDPATDNWTPVSTFGAPPVSYGHTAVWTGSQMVIWGGSGYQSNGRYDPATDSWRPVSTIGEPAPRSRHTAVWTGIAMVVWGGQDYPSQLGLNSGGRYDPTVDTWASTSTTGAPSGRYGHTAVWTGSSMVIWGGTADSSGGRYNPATDSWSPTSTINAPTPRSKHSAVWTGTGMTVWGGDSGGRVNTGARYDPTTNSWSPTSTTGSPTPRSSHTAVWTGKRMLIWGGQTDVAPHGDNSGGKHDPVTNGWSPMSTAGAPSWSEGLTSVWTGTFMMVWGGDGRGGGRYSLGAAVDDDGDGFSECQGDCDDVDATTYPGAVEICDGRNNDCSDPTWPALPASEANADSDQFRVCQGDCDDTTAAVYPAAIQWCDGVNNDCNDPAWPTVPANELDADNDGYRVCGGDCNDSANTVYPEAPQTCGGIDNNCDGIPDGPRYFVNCVNGNDSNSGQTEPTAIRTLNEAMNRIHAATAEGLVCVAAGSCPSEGGIRLPDEVKIVGAGMDVTDVQDTLYSNQCWEGEPCPEEAVVALEKLSLNGLEWTGIFGRVDDPVHDVAMDRVRCRGLLSMGGDDGRLSVSDSTIGAIHAAPAYGPNVTIARSEILGLASFDSYEPGGNVSLLDSAFGNVMVDSRGNLEVRRSRFRGGSGVALHRRSSAYSEGQTVVTDSVFGGYPNHIKVDMPDEEGGDYDTHIERNTFINAGGSSIILRPVEPWPMVVSGNAFRNVGQTAIDAFSAESVFVERNNFDNVYETVCVSGYCFDTLEDLNASDWGEGNLDVASMFVDFAGGNFHLLPNSPLIDAGSGNPSTGVTDADGMTRPVDGNSDSISIHDIGAFEFTDPDHDSIDSRDDNCPNVSNPSQSDTDNDNVGDACDNCLTVPNPNQEDPDADQRGSVCDNCPTSYNPTQSDGDGDRVGDTCDNCALNANPGQVDFDQDGQGDLCDLNDGLIYIYGPSGHNFVEWQDESAYSTWNVYRGDLAVLKSTGVYAQPPGSNPLAARWTGINDPWLQDTDVVPVGKAAFYLTTGTSGGVEGGLGSDSEGNDRPNRPGIVYDNASTSGDLFPVSGNLTVSYSHTIGVGLSDRLLIVFTNGRQGTGAPVGNCRAGLVTFAGVPMTSAGSAIAVDSTDFKTVVEAWYLVNPSAGTASVQMTFPGDCTGIKSNAISFASVDPTLPVRATASSTITSQQTCVLATSVAASPGGWAVDAFAYNRGSDATPQFAEQVSRVESHSSAGSVESSTRAAGGNPGANPPTLGWNVGGLTCGRAVHLVISLGPS